MFEERRDEHCVHIVPIYAKIEIQGMKGQIFFRRFFLALPIC